MSEQDIEKLVADHAALQNENAVLKEELAELQQQMAWLKNQMFDRKTEQTYTIMDGSTQLEAALLTCVKLPVDRTFLIGLAVILEEILKELDQEEKVYFLSVEPHLRVFEGLDNLEPDDSTASKILELVESASENKSKSEEFISKFAA